MKQTADYKVDIIIRTTNVESTWFQYLLAKSLLPLINLSPYLNQVIIVNSNFQELSSIGATEQVLAKSSDEISQIETIKAVIDSLGLVEVEIDFSNIFESRSSLKKIKRIVLPVRYRNQSYKIKIDQSDLANHRKVREIIERELQLNLLNEKDLLYEQYRADELSRLRREKERSFKENDYNPATGTKDGRGFILPLTIR